MRLTAPTTEHILRLMSWFNSEAQLSEWAGPNFAYPYNVSSFRRDLKLTTLDSFSLLDKTSTLLAFGQCYERMGCCHLGRLVVAPEHRGKSLAATLIEKISDQGKTKFDTSQTSLFVLEHNHAAISAYKKSGFEVRDYPEKIPLPECLYMVKE